jgi:nucleoid DNA-binding protein
LAVDFLLATPPPCFRNFTVGNGFFDSVVAHLRLVPFVNVSFGTFFLFSANPYTGKNPRTGAVVAVPPRSRLVFLPADGWLSDVFGPTAERWRADDYIAELVYDDTREPIAIPQATALPPPSEVLDEVVGALRSEGRWELAGFGALLVRSAPLPSGGPHTRDALVVRFKESVVLRTMSWRSPEDRG